MDNINANKSKNHFYQIFEIHSGIFDKNKLLLNICAGFTVAFLYTNLPYQQDTAVAIEPWISSLPFWFFLHLVTCGQIPCLRR
jgi:hypothetical protein